MASNDNALCLITTMCAGPFCPIGRAYSAAATYYSYSHAAKMENGGNEVVNAAEAASSNQVDENLLDDAGGDKKIHEHEFESLLSKAISDMRGEFNSRISHLEEGTTTTRETSALSGSSAGSRNESTGRRNSYYVEVGNIEIPSVLAEEEVGVKQGFVPSDSGVGEFDDIKSRRRRSSCPNHTALEQSTFSLLLSEEVGTIPHTFALRIALVWQYATARDILKRLSLVLGRSTFASFILYC